MKSNIKKGALKKSYAIEDLFWMFRKLRYRDREDGIDSFGVQPSILYPL